MALETATRTDKGLAMGTIMLGVHEALVTSQVAEASDQVAEASNITLLPKPFVARADFTGGQSAIAQDHQFRFKCLTAGWHEERGISSSITEIAMCPSYQRIIAMGEDVVPLILAKLESEGDEPDMWFWALRVISNEDPVTERDRGNVRAMAATWLRWGQERYVW